MHPMLCLKLALFGFILYIHNISAKITLECSPNALLTINRPTDVKLHCKITSATKPIKIEWFYIRKEGPNELLQDPLLNQKLVQKDVDKDVYDVSNEFEVNQTTVGTYRIVVYESSDVLKHYDFMIKYFGKGVEDYIPKYSRPIGHDEEFECHIAEAPPSEDIKWYFKDQELSQGQKIGFKAKNFLRNAIIKIKFLELDDSGTYICEYKVGNKTYKGYFKLVVKDYKSILWPIIGLITNGIVVSACIFIPILIRRGGKRFQFDYKNSEVKFIY